MALEIGKTLGPYEITALLGKGGMGEVYKAHDPRLNRDVAIKVSAEQFSEKALTCAGRWISKTRCPSFSN